MKNKLLPASFWGCDVTNHGRDDSQSMTHTHISSGESKIEQTAMWNKIHYVTYMQLKNTAWTRKQQAMSKSIKQTCFELPVTFKGKLPNLTISVTGKKGDGQFWQVTVELASFSCQK